jgi:two-component system chemotaxis response regulator CheY
MATIAVADDDPTIRALLEAVLTRAGHTVLAAGDGREALKLFREGCPDLLVTDHEMPSMNGSELCRALRRLSGCQQTPVILLTAHGDLDEVWSLRRDVYGWLCKPFQSADLLGLIEGALADGGVPAPV